MQDPAEGASQFPMNCEVFPFDWREATLVLRLPSTDPFSHLNGFPPGFWCFLTPTCANQYSAEYSRVTLCIFPEFFFLGHSIFSGTLSGKFFSDSQFHLISWWSLQAPPRDFILHWWPGNSLKTINRAIIGLTSIFSPSLKGLCLLLALCPFCLSQEEKIWFVIWFILHGNESLFFISLKIKASYYIAHMPLHMPCL